jgi:septum formation protein
MAIVLASASPRRQELLKNAGISFVVRAANIAEIPLECEAPRTFALRMAREKARAVWPNPDGLYVLGADTVVVIDDRVLGKPQDENDAAKMLRLLSGREHQVITGVCLLGNDFEDVRAETTTVQFSALSESEIKDYIRSGEPADKAGAYAIQGGASRWVSKIEGDYANVVGLPVELVVRMLRERGIVAG